MLSVLLIQMEGPVGLDRKNFKRYTRSSRVFEVDKKKVVKAIFGEGFLLLLL